MDTNFIPYCQPLIGEEEIAEVVDSIRGGWITTGPKVKRFERDFADYIGSPCAVATNSCTAGLHVALAALGVGLGDEVIVPTMTFCATANVVVHLGATPVLIDVKEDFQIDPECVERAITPRTRAIVPVHYGGQACDLDEILGIARSHHLRVIEDAAHAAGAEYKGRKIGNHGDAVIFSFYATKNMTTGEGGMIATADPELAERMRMLTLHGMNRDAWNRYSKGGSWAYDVCAAGYKYNMTDIQAALGIHQLRRLDGFIKRRQEIAAKYDVAFAGLETLCVPGNRGDRTNVYHLYPVRVSRTSGMNREEFIAELQRANIGASVHFIPLHRHSFYRDRGYRPDAFPVAERLYDGLVSLPLYPRMEDEDVRRVSDTVRNIILSARGKGAGKEYGERARKASVA